MQIWTIAPLQLILLGRVIWFIGLIILMPILTWMLACLLFPLLLWFFGSCGKIGTIGRLINNFRLFLGFFIKLWWLSITIAIVILLKELNLFLLRSVGNLRIILLSSWYWWVCNLGWVCNLVIGNNYRKLLVGSYFGFRLDLRFWLAPGRLVLRMFWLLKERRSWSSLSERSKFPESGGRFKDAYWFDQWRH